MLIGQSWRDAVAVIGGTPGGNGLLISGNKGAWRGKVKLKQQTGRTHAAGGARLSTHTQTVCLLQRHTVAAGGHTVWRNKRHLRSSWAK